MTPPKLPQIGKHSNTQQYFSPILSMLQALYHSNPIHQKKPYTTKKTHFYFRLGIFKHDQISLYMQIKISNII